MGISAEILCIGSELLLGQIVNTNAHFLATELARLGIPHHYQTVVGDNPARIQEVLALASERAGLIITTGGLGPTVDDLTHETLAEFFGVSMVLQNEELKRIEAMFQERQRVMAPSNAKQAMLPLGAMVLSNPIGTAPGLIWQPRSDVTVLTFPGVPREMKRMWAETAVPYLQAQGWGQEVFYSRMLRHWGISESTLAERVSSFLEGSNPTVAPYAHAGEAKLRITARAPNPESARQLIAPVEAQLREIAGLDCFGADEDSLASVVAELLIKRGESVAIAESCTGGLLSEQLTNLPGASQYFLGSVVAYANTAKSDLLGVSTELMIAHGVVSAPVVEAMAIGVRKAFGSDWGLAITGIAGPGGGTAQKPVGLVCIALASAQGVVSQEHQFSSRWERELIRQVSAQSALDFLRRTLVRSASFGIMERQ
jgi:nicotinamide-nucleotide amidase